MTIFEYEPFRVRKPQKYTWLSPLTTERQGLETAPEQLAQLDSLTLTHPSHGPATWERGSVTEWSERRTRNPAVPGSSPALATCWICTRSSWVQILGHACK